MSNIDSKTIQEEEWRCAAQLIDMVKISAAGFSSTIRFLCKDAADGKELSPASSFLMRRFINCPSVLAPMYYATLTYHYDRLAGKKQIVADDILACYSPDMLAVMLFAIYCSAHMRRRADRDEWTKQARLLAKYTELAVPFGIALPELGPSRALLIAAMRPLSFAVFLTVDPERFKKYRRQLVQQRMPHNLSEERRLWGCTHYHLGALLTQIHGLGTEFSNMILPVALNLSKKQTSQQAMLIKIAITWFDALVLTGEAPKQVIGDDIIVSENSIDRLFEVVNSFKNLSGYDWICKRATDITAETHPELFVAGAALGDSVKPARTASIKRPKEGEYDDIPDEFRALFSQQEFQSLLSEIQELMKDNH